MDYLTQNPIECPKCHIVTTQWVSDRKTFGTIVIDCPTCGLILTDFKTIEGEAI